MSFAEREKYRERMSRFVKKNMASIHVRCIKLVTQFFLYTLNLSFFFYRYEKQRYEILYYGNLRQLKLMMVK
jgi:hypothetical protein